MEEPPVSPAGVQNSTAVTTAVRRAVDYIIQTAETKPDLVDADVLERDQAEVRRLLIQVIQDSLDEPTSFGEEYHTGRTQSWQSDAPTRLVATLSFLEVTTNDGKGFNTDATSELAPYKFNHNLMAFRNNLAFVQTVARTSKPNITQLLSVIRKVFHDIPMCTNIQLGQASAVAAGLNQAAIHTVLQKPEWITQYLHFVKHPRAAPGSFLDLALRDMLKAWLPIGNLRSAPLGEILVHFVSRVLPLNVWKTTSAVLANEIESALTHKHITLAKIMSWRRRYTLQFNALVLGGEKPLETTAAQSSGKPKFNLKPPRPAQPQPPSQPSPGGNPRKRERPNKVGSTAIQTDNTKVAAKLSPCKYCVQAGVQPEQAMHWQSECTQPTAIAARNAKNTSSKKNSKYSEVSTTEQIPMGSDSATITTLYTSTTEPDQLNFNSTYGYIPIEEKGQPASNINNNQLKVDQVIPATERQVQLLHMYKSPHTHHHPDESRDTLSVHPPSATKPASDPAETTSYVSGDAPEQSWRLNLSDQTPQTLRSTSASSADQNHINTQHMPLVYVGIIVNKRLCRALLDSGAQANVISRSLTGDAKTHTSRYATIKGLHQAHTINVLGQIALPVQWGNQTGELVFQVIDHDSPIVILGVNNLFDAGANFGVDNNNQRTLSLGGQQCYEGVDGVFYPEFFNIQELAPLPQGEDDLETVNKFYDSVPPTKWVSPMQRPPGNTLQIGSKQSVQVHHITTTNQQWQNKHAAWDNINTNVDPRIVGSPDPQFIIQLTTEESQILLGIQNQLIHLTESPLKDCEAPAEFGMEFHLREGVQMEQLREPPRHHSQTNSAILENHIQEGLKSGLIEKVPPSAGIPKAITNHCFPTTDAKTRVCVTAERSNKFVENVAIAYYSVAQIRQMLPAQATVFTVIDIRWAFNLLPVKEPFRHFTSFYGTKGDFYRYKRAAFGFKNAPAYWNRYLKEVFKDMPFVISFVDDLCIASLTVHEHIIHLSRVVQRLIERCLPVRWQKIQLMRLTVQYVGSTLSSKDHYVTVAPTQMAVEKIKDFPTPKNASDILAFLGVARWISKHVKDLEKPLAMLNPLVRKNQKFQWTQREQNAFDEAKRLCINYFENQVIDWESNLTLKVRTDASDWGIGAGLYQSTQDGGERLIELYSAAFNGTQQRWAPINKEAYAIVRVLGTWKHILQGVYFELYTDHRALIFLIHLIQENGGNQMLERWFASILSFNFGIHHIPGPQNVVQDVLSRPPWVPVTSDERRNTISLSETGSTTDAPQSVEDTISDAFVNLICTDVQNQGPTSPFVQTQNGLELQINFLTIEESQLDNDPFYQAALRVARGEDATTWHSDDPGSFYTQALGEIQSRIFLEHDRLRLRGVEDQPTVTIVTHKQLLGLLSQLHDSPFGGHYGIDQTVRNVKERYFRPRIKTVVTEYINSCHECQQGANKSSTGSWFNMKPFEVHSPWNLIHVDLMEMTVESSEGHKYMLVVRCAGSGYTDMRALFTKSQEEVLAALIDIYSHYGFPRTTTLDRGSEFANYLLREFNLKLNIVENFTTAGIHHANGMAERAIQEIRAYLRKFKAGQHWHLYIPFMRYAINSRSLPRFGNLSPAQLLQGRKFLHPIDIEEMGGEYAFINQPDWLKNVARLRQAARETLQQSRQHMAERHAQKRGRGDHQTPLTVGDAVYVQNDDTSRGYKQRSNWLGPFTISSLSHDNLRVRYRDEDGQEYVTHANQIKRTREFQTDPELRRDLSKVPRVIAASDLIADDQPNDYQPLEPLEQAQQGSPPLSNSEPHSSQTHSSQFVTGEGMALSSPAPANHHSQRTSYVHDHREDSDHNSQIQTPQEMARNHFEAESIIAARGSVNQDRYYRVIWKGYGPGDNTWEPEKHFARSRSLVDNFIRDNNIPEKMANSVVIYPIHPSEIVSINKLNTCRSSQRGDKESRILELQMTGDEDRVVKVDIATLAKLCTLQQIQSKCFDTDLKKRITIAYNKYGNTAIKLTQAYVAR